MKAAIIVLSDPNGGDEALGRVFNALAVAYDYKQQGEEVTIIFQGAGTRWIGELSKPTNPVHELFNEIQDVVAGVSRGCAEVFAAAEEVERSPFDFIRGNDVPRTAGLPSLHSLAKEGYIILTF